MLTHTSRSILCPVAFQTSRNALATRFNATNLTTTNNGAIAFNVQKRNSAIDKMLRSKRFRGNIHKKKSLENWLKWKKQTKGMVSEQWKEIVDKNRKNALPHWTPVTEFDHLYHKHIYDLQFAVKKGFRDSNLIKMLDLVQNIDDLTRVMQLWRVTLRRPVRYTVQFTEALVEKLLQFGEVDAAVALASSGRLVFLPVNRSTTKKLVEKLGEEQRSDDIVKIFESAAKGQLSFTPVKSDYLFFMQQLKGQEQALKVFFTYPGDYRIANIYLQDGHENETYEIAIETCKALNDTRKAEHIYHEMLYNCEDSALLEKAKTIVSELRAEFPVAEEATEEA